MKIYFLSSEPCALTLNGVFYGVTDKFERFAEISLSDNVYAQFSPQGKLPVGLFLNEKLTTAPPEGCEVYLLKDGVAVYACDFPPVDFTLRPVTQAREGDLLATVFSQGKLQLSVESPEGFFNATLPPSFDPCSVRFHCGLVVVIGQNTLALCTRTGKILLLETFTHYSLTKNGLNATLPLSDALQRTAECSWTLTENECTLTDFVVKEPQRRETISEDLLAYAFFESVLLHADYAAFLSEELAPDAEQIVEFLGEFRSVTLTREPNVCGLVRKKGERLFTVDYFSVTIEGGKIVDVAE